jgi:hypothetical protein
MTRTRRRLTFAFSVATVLLVGCQLLVPSDVPDFKCASADPSACPSGMTCDTTAGRCVSSALTPEGGEEEDVVVPSDAKDVKDVDAPITAAELGADCTANGDCKSQICGTSTILTTTIIPGASKSICTQTCCTSGDCPTGFVCFGTGTGGNYCVPAVRAQRSTPGTKAPGAACVGSTDCRSGLCAGSPLRCIDTCCTASDCTSPTTCRVKIINVPPPDRETWTCAPAETTGTKDPPLACGSGTECKSDNCAGFPKKCRPSCCNATHCSAFGANAFCAYGTFLTTNADTKWCFDPPTAGAALGATCNGDIDCASRLCDPESKKCVTACCRDGDCAQGKVCRPSPTGAPLLRCVDPR